MESSEETFVPLSRDMHCVIVDVTTGMAARLRRYQSLTLVSFAISVVEKVVPKSIKF